MSFYVPGTGETDLKKIIMSLQQAAGTASTSVQSVTAGTGITVAGTAINPVISASSAVNNLLPNVQWQAWVALSGFNGAGTCISITKQNSTGTASQTPITVTGFDTSNNTPRLFTANTQAVRLGDLILLPDGFWGYAGAGHLSNASGGGSTARVIVVNHNVSITVQGNFGGVSPTVSAASTATPISAGDLGSGTGQCADGWKKTPTLIVWPDDFTANAYPGAIRPMGIRKGASSSEVVEWIAPSNQIAKYAGRTITFGVAVKQTVQTGGTCNLSIVDNIGGTTSSANGTGVSFGGYEFLSVTATIAQTCTSLTIGLYLNGTTNDVYYVALPTAVFGSSLVQSDLQQNPMDMVRTVSHWNPPLLTPFQIDFPSSAFPGTGILFGWSGIDIEALSAGAVHNSVNALKCKIEWTTPTVGALIFTGSRLDYSLIFGPQQGCSVTSILSVGQGELYLADDGTMCLFTATSGLHMYGVGTATFDFDVIRLAMPCAAN